MSETVPIPLRPVNQPSEFVLDAPERMPVPRGWTELIHGTDSNRWGANDAIKHIVGIDGLPAVEAKETARERAMMPKVSYLSPDAYNTTANFTLSKVAGVVPVELRIIAPSQDLAFMGPRTGDLKDVYNRLTEKEKALIPKIYLARHPVVPRGENIIKIGERVDPASGRKILEYVPDSYADSYIAAVEGGGDAVTAEKFKAKVGEARKYIASFERETALVRDMQKQVRDSVDIATKKLEDSTGDRVIGLWTANLAVRKARQRTLLDESRLLRPSSAEDEAYRLRVFNELTDHIKQALPAESPIRFHGTSLIATESIIKSGELSSAVDRIGMASSYDAADQVSVTMPHDVWISVDRLGLVERNCTLPTGCLFVLMPKDAEEAAAGNQQLMDNVYFGEHPEQFVGILTSDENLPSVREWLTKAKLDPNRAQEFFEGVALLKDAQSTIEP